MVVLLLLASLILVLRLHRSELTHQFLFEEFTRFALAAEHARNGTTTVIFEVLCDFFAPFTHICHQLFHIGLVLVDFVVNLLLQPLHDCLELLVFVSKRSEEIILNISRVQGD